MISTADYIKTLVDSAPPLTPTQRHRLAVLLRPDMGALVERHVVHDDPVAIAASDCRYLARDPPQYQTRTLAALLRLHFQHKVCRFSGVDKPPRETGMT